MRLAALLLLAALGLAAVAPDAGARKLRRIAAKAADFSRTGLDGEGRLAATAAFGNRKPFGVALFERRDIPVYEPGTVADCFAYGPVDSLARTRLWHFSMTCRPRDPRALEVGAGAYDTEGRVTPERFRDARRAGRRLPGTTLVAGHAGSAVDAVVVDGPGRRVVARTSGTDGAFLVVWDGWLEQSKVRVTAVGARRGRWIEFGRAKLYTDPYGHTVVLPPQTDDDLTPRRPPGR